MGLKLNDIITNGTGPSLQVEEIKPLANKKKFLFKFKRANDKSVVFSKSKFLRNRGVTIEEDLPLALREDKNMLLMNRKQLFDNGVAESVKVKRRGMLVDEKDWYFYDRNNKTMGKHVPQQRNTTNKSKQQ